jgi:hypothetical protein
MLVIGRGNLESIIALKHKLCDPEKESECIGELERIMNVKQLHLWRADSLSPCCGGDICSLVPQFEAEAGILRDALDALKAGENSKAANLLEDYLAFLQKSYRSEASVIEGLGFSENKQRQL